MGEGVKVWMNASEVGRIAEVTANASNAGAGAALCNVGLGGRAGWLLSDG